MPPRRPPRPPTPRPRATSSSPRRWRRTRRRLSRRAASIAPRCRGTQHPSSGRRCRASRWRRKARPRRVRRTSSAGTARQQRRTSTREGRPARTEGRSPPSRVRSPVRIRRIAETRADREDGPVPDVLDERQLAQSLNDRIVVHDHDRLVLADGRKILADLRREVEATALPITRQVLSAALDGPVFPDLPRTRDADERRELEIVLVGPSDETLEHGGDA